MHKSKLTAARQSRIVKALSLGASYATAAQYAGISSETFRQWRQRGASSASGKYYDLAQAVVEAEGQAKIGALETVETAHKNGDWRAATWLLERREPKGYAARQESPEPPAAPGESVAEVSAAVLRSLLEVLPAPLSAAIREHLSELTSKDDDGTQLASDNNS